MYMCMSTRNTHLWIDTQIRSAERKPKTGRNKYRDIHVDTSTYSAPCVYIYIYMHAGVCVCVCIDAHVTYMYMYVCIQLCAHIYGCIHRCTHMHVPACMIDVDGA